MSWFLLLPLISYHLCFPSIFIVDLFLLINLFTIPLDIFIWFYFLLSLLILFLVFSFILRFLSHSLRPFLFLIISYLSLFFFPYYFIPSCFLFLIPLLIFSLSGLSYFLSSLSPLVPSYYSILACDSLSGIYLISFICMESESKENKLGSLMSAPPRLASPYFCSYFTTLLSCSKIIFRFLLYFLASSTFLLYIYWFTSS